MRKTAKDVSPSPAKPSPQELLQGYISAALKFAQTAKRHGQSLNGVNFYADKMADLRTDAARAFQRLSGRSVDDTAALVELMEKVFSSDASPKERANAARQLQYALKTAWADARADQTHLEEVGVFPLVTLNQTKRGYLVAVGRQANGCYLSEWYDGCAVMMRRLLESSIIEAFEAKKLDSNIKDSKTGDFFQLTALIDAALREKTWNLPRNVRKGLPDLRDLGHRSAHNRYYLAKKPDIDKHAGVYREAVEAFLHLATLL